MKRDTRTRMVVGAVEMLARRGLSATSVREVVRQTETPRGSIAHHFPQGRPQLVEEALRYADQATADALAALCGKYGVRAGLRRFLDGWCRHLRANDFALGCPVLSVCVESAEAEDATQRALLALSAEVLGRWHGILADALRREGVAAADARRLAHLVLAALEGGIVLCRAQHSTAPLDDIGQSIDALLAQALAQP